MSIELKQAAQDAAEAIDWLLKNIRLDAPQLSGKAMGNAEKCASALRAALSQQPATATACGIPGMAKTTCPYCDQEFAFEHEQPVTPEPIGQVFYAADGGDDETGAGYHMKPYVHWFDKASAADSKLYTAPKPAQATQPAEVTDGFILVNRGTIESAMQHVPYRGEVWQELNAAMLSLRTERVPMTDEVEKCAVVAWAHFMDTCRKKRISPADWGDWCSANAIRKSNHGITAQAKKVGA